MFYYVSGTVAHVEPYLAVIDCGGVGFGCRITAYTAGQLKLHDVEPKTAAMIMAIVANKMGKPLNELRFISIKEVK